MTFRFVSVCFILFTLATATLAQDSSAWKQFTGKPGPSGWRCHVIQPDPNNDGPDGINLHDWDGDGDLDVFANAEEGKYSRLYFNPGRDKIHGVWNDFIQFKHGNCEDSGIGDLDNDGDIDYVANGGRIFFNPGTEKVRDAEAWKELVLFKEEQRVPTVVDLDGDGLNDLVVGGHDWYKQPATDKHDRSNWQKFVIGKNRWAMNCIMSDVDKDGDLDMVVPDRGVDVSWYENPGTEQVTKRWKRRLIHKHTEPMFMAVADVNGDAIEDFVITGGSKGEKAKTLIVLLRTNQSGVPTFEEHVIDQPSGLFPKGVAVADFEGDAKVEILVLPKTGDFWIANFNQETQTFDARFVKTPGANTRKKMDNAWLGDLDGDGDLDFVTTEENGGWGVIWFENPADE